MGKYLDELNTTTTQDWLKEEQQERTTEQIERILHDLPLDHRDKQWIKERLRALGLTTIERIEALERYHTIYQTTFKAHQYPVEQRTINNALRAANEWLRDYD